MMLSAEIMLLHKNNLGSQKRRTQRRCAAVLPLLVFITFLFYPNSDFSVDEIFKKLGWPAGNGSCMCGIRRARNLAHEGTWCVGVGS